MHTTSHSQTPTQFSGSGCLIELLQQCHAQDFFRDDPSGTLEIRKLAMARFRVRIRTMMLIVVVLGVAIRSGHEPMRLHRWFQHRHMAESERTEGLLLQRAGMVQDISGFMKRAAEFRRLAERDQPDPLGIVCLVACVLGFLAIWFWFGCCLGKRVSNLILAWFPERTQPEDSVDREVPKRSGKSSEGVRRIP